MSDDQDQLLHPGHFIVSSILMYSSTGSKMDITNVYTELNIQESIAKGWVSGTITVQDLQGLQNIMPLIGGEFVEIRYKTPSVEDQVLLKASVIDIQNRVQPQNQMDLYNIKFISQEAVQTTKFKVRTSYKTTSHSDVVQNICDEYFSTKPLVINEKTKASSFVVCNRSPFNAIQWIAARSKSKRYSGSNYVFFERLGETPGFVFSSLENLVDPDFVTPVIAYDRAIGNVEPATKKNVQREFNAINTFRWMAEPNTVRSMQTGTFSSRLQAFDPVTGFYNNTKFNYFSSYNDYKHLNRNKKTGQEMSGLHNDVQLGSYDDANISLGAKHYGLFESGVLNVEDYHLERKSQLHQMGIAPGGLQLELELAGDSRRAIGEVVKVTIPRSGLASIDEDNKDKYYSGNYLIVAIKHQIVPPQNRDASSTTCTMKMTLASDSFGTPLPVAAPS